STETERRDEATFRLRAASAGIHLPQSQWQQARATTGHLFATEFLKESCAWQLLPAGEYRWRHLALLISILLLFVVAPFVVPLHHGILVMNVISVAVLVAGSYALSERKHLFAIAVVLSAITIVGTALLVAFPQPWALLISHSSIIVLVAFFCVTILSYVLGSGRVTSDKIFAAICYFSFMTLTTVDYGDIVPHSPAPRTMTILEAVMGQFYLVALVGCLVGLHIV